MSTNNDIRKAVWGWVITNCYVVEGRKIDYYGYGFEEIRVKVEGTPYWTHLSQEETAARKNKIVTYIKANWRSIELPVVIHGTLFAGTGNPSQEVSILSVRINIDGEEFYLGSRTYSKIPDWMEGFLSKGEHEDVIEKYAKILD